MNSVLESILSTNTVIDLQGNSKPLHSSFSRESGTLLKKWVAESNCTNAIEVGLAFGISALFILEELTKNPQGHLYGIDPMQFDDGWSSIGIENIKRAGYEDNYRLYNEPSYTALPTMIKEGVTCQFALIDGWHTFDYTLVDFFMIDKMLDVGGIIVFDDVGYKAITKVITFVLSNMQYEFVDCFGYNKQRQEKSDLKEQLKKTMARFAKDDWSQSTDTRSIFSEIVGNEVVVVQKTGDDERRWDHFIPF